MRSRQIINVANGGDIQAAVLTMKPGDILSLAPGGSYTFAGGVAGFANLPNGFRKHPTTVRGNGATITGGAQSLTLSAKFNILFEDLFLIDATDRPVVNTNCRFITYNRVYADSNVNFTLWDVFRFIQSRNITCNDCEAGPTTGWGEHDGFECTDQCGDMTFNRCKASGVIHGFETWSDPGPLTWVNYRILINDCIADNCRVGYSAEGGDRNLQQVDMIVTNSISTNMINFDFQGVQGSTIYRKNSVGTTNGSVVDL